MITTIILVVNILSILFIIKSLKLIHHTILLHSISLIPDVNSILIPSINDKFNELVLLAKQMRSFLTFKIILPNISSIIIINLLFILYLNNTYINNTYLFFMILPISISLTQSIIFNFQPSWLIKWAITLHSIIDDITLQHINSQLQTIKQAINNPDFHSLPIQQQNYIKLQAITLLNIINNMNITSNPNKP